LASHVILRPYAASDRERLLALRSLAFSELASAHYSREELAAARAHAEEPSYAQDLQDCNLMLAVDQDGIVLGAAGWSAQDDEPGTARIRKVFVHPGSAGRGLGTTLVRDAERRARAAGYERFIIRSSLNAVSFYHKLGYRIVEMANVPRPSDIRLPVVVMRKS
jgi:putative acetyltransferase